jgi:lactoylglutathione lyase
MTPTTSGQGGHPIRSIDYVILFVRNLDRSIAFYRDYVRLPFKFSEAGYAEFATDGTRFALFEQARVPALIRRAVREGGPAGEVVVVVEDVDAEAERLRSAGVEILTGPVDRPWGHRTIHIQDPDGNVVEFAQRIPRTEGRNDG